MSLDRRELSENRNDGLERPSYYEMAVAEPYLIRLGNRLIAGLSRLDADRRERHRSFILSRQNTDGGFSGRDVDEEEEPAERESDLYYTGFAVRSLAAMQCFSPDDAERVANFLRLDADRKGNVIDLVTRLYCALVIQVTSGIDILTETDPDWATRLPGFLESLRRADGGYAKTHEGAAGSTYHSFLVALCYELIGGQVPEPERLLQFLYDRQRDDGGFVEIAPMKRSGTNPTAAAVAVLQLHGEVDHELRADVRAFLADVKGDEGGFQANTRIPFADSLSTFTGLLTCQDLGIDDVLTGAAVERYINALEFPAGGFRGASWDEQADVEYTFYGLGTLGLLWSAAATA